MCKIGETGKIGTRKDESYQSDHSISYVKQDG